MDGRQIRYVRERQDPQEIQSAIDAILGDINSVSSDRGFQEYIDRQFREIDDLRLVLARRGDHHIPTIQRLIMNGCEPDDDEPVTYDGKVTASEQAVADELMQCGCIVLRNGWPDFLVIKGKRIFAVEVKQRGERTASAPIAVA